MRVHIAWLGIYTILSIGLAFWSFRPSPPHWAGWAAMAAGFLWFGALLEIQRLWRSKGR